MAKSDLVINIEIDESKLQEYSRFSKALMRFVEDLYDRGLLSKSVEELDYEGVIFDYLSTSERQ